MGSSPIDGDTGAAASESAHAACSDQSMALIPRGSRVLTVGDGDFVFSEALAEAHRPLGVGKLVATTLDSEDEIRSLYAEAPSRLERLRAAGAEVVCGVDARRLGQADHLDNVEPFDRIVFNFPLLPVKAHAKGTRTVDVHVANRRMLVEFLQRAPVLLRPDGVVAIASKECFPYSWWRLDALPQWAGGELRLVASLPWQHTEYPSLYRGPCNVNKDASVKPTDAEIFVYAREGCNPRLGLPTRVALDSCASGSGVGPSDDGSKCRRPVVHKDFFCELCKVRGMRSESELENHQRGKIHQKREALERRWEEQVLHERVGKAARGDERSRSRGVSD